MRKDWKHISLLWGNWNSGMEQMLISGYSDGCNQHFYKRKAQVLQLNSAGHLKRRRRLCHKSWINVSPLYWYGIPSKTKVVNGLSDLFDLQGQTIDMSDQSVFTLKDSGNHDKRGGEINIINQLTSTQRQLGHFVSFMITVHQYQADPKFKYSNMTCRACVQLPLDVYGIDDNIDTQIMTSPHIRLVHMVPLDNGRNPDVGTLNKQRG